jgi:hypothetical protein
VKAADAAEAEFDGDIVLPAVSTSGFAFQAILDDLVRTVGDDELAASIASAAERSHAQTRGPDTPSHLSADGLSGPLVSAEDALESSPGGAGGGADGMRGPDTPSHLSADGLSGPFVGSAAEDSAGQPTAAAVGASGARPPALLRGRGDLTLVIGLGADALAAARALAEAIGDAEVRPGGCSRAPAARVDDRRGALRARADGVRRERAVVVAFGMTRGADEVAELAEALAGIAPDQVWAAVDASRKAEDTAAWVRAVDAVLAVDALVVTGSQVTATPGSVRELGIPIGWLDGAMVSAGPVGTAPVGIG